MGTKKEYNMDDLKVNRYLKAAFKASDFFKKSKNIENDYNKFMEDNKKDKVEKKE
ncbi:MAG: hypothetical protein ACRC1M_05745 [Methanobacteriaceae archaeon]